MRFLCSILLLIALLILVSSEDDCKNTCPNEFDVHCATDETCFYISLSACLAELQSCYRVKRGLPAFTKIHRGYCNWGMPRCKAYKD